MLLYFMFGEDYFIFYFNYSRFTSLIIIITIIFIVFSMQLIEL